MSAIRHVAWWALLSIGLIGAISPLPRLERVQPPAEHHWSRQATPEEAKGADLIRDLEQWRTELNGARR